MKLSKNTFTPQFKAKVACEALRENKSTNEIASDTGVHQCQINKWKKTILEKSSVLFERKDNKKKRHDVDVEEYQRIIGEQAIQLAWYKKKLGVTHREKD